MTTNLFSQLAALGTDGNASYSEAQQADAHISAVKELTTAGVKGALKLDLDELHRRTSNTLKLFDEVTWFLREFDFSPERRIRFIIPKWIESGSTTPLELNPELLTEKWTGFNRVCRHLECVDLFTKFALQEYIWTLLNSLDLADSIAATAEEFQKTILPLVASVNTTGNISPETREEIKKVIKTIGTFIQDNKEAAATAKRLSDSFRSLQTNISSFEKSFDKIEEQEVPTIIREAVQGLNQKLSNLSNELTELDTLMSGIPDALGIAAVAAPVLGFFSCFGLCMMEGAAGIVMDPASAADRYNALRDEMKKLEEDKYTLTNNVGGILKLRGQLEHMGADHLSNVIQGLEFFEVIWNSVNSDCVKIQKYLQDIEKASNTTRPIPTIMVVYLKNTNTIYSAISQALKDYASTIKKAFGDEDE